MLKIFLLCFLTTLVVGIEHKCKFRSQPGIELSGILGWWNFQQMVIDCIDLSDPVCHGLDRWIPEAKEFCLAMDFQEDKNSHKFTHVSRLHYNFFGHNEMPYGVNVVDEHNAGLLRTVPAFLDEEFHDTQELHIIHTDYHNTALIATCHNNTIFAGMLSRGREPLDREIVSLYTQLAQKNGFYSKFQPIDHMHYDCDHE